MARIRISLNLGPMVRIDIEGESCPEIVAALTDFEKLNDTVDSMFSDLAQRVFPDGVPSGEKDAS
jgi:hypothetical protein